MVVFSDKVLCQGDNLEVLQDMDSESVDLIYLDPPFNSKRTYSAPASSKAHGATFKDVWGLENMTWDDLLYQYYASLHAFLEASEKTHGKGIRSYLTMMSIRLIEMRRVLKPTGSIYLHCDQTASHYLKVVMDSIFGVKNFRNDISWKRSTSHSDGRNYGRVLDHILYYVKNKPGCWNGDSIKSPKSNDFVRMFYVYGDSHGSFKRRELTGPNHGASLATPSSLPWRGYDVAAKGRVWSVPKTGAYAEYIEREFIPGYRSIEDIHERLDALDKAGLLFYTKSNKQVYLKYYAAADTGNLPTNLILKPTGFTNYKFNNERTGYPTQKPLALLKRIIKVSSNEGDVVLDPFCGSGTTLEAAESLGRKWIGIDSSSKAIEVSQLRLRDSMGGLLFDNAVSVQRIEEAGDGLDL